MKHIYTFKRLRIKFMEGKWVYLAIFIFLLSVALGFWDGPDLKKELVEDAPVKNEPTVIVEDAFGYTFGKIWSSKRREEMGCVKTGAGWDCITSSPIVSYPEFDEYRFNLSQGGELASYVRANGRTKTFQQCVSIVESYISQMEKKYQAKFKKEKTIPSDVVGKEEIEIQRVDWWLGERFMLKFKQSQSRILRPGKVEIELPEEGWQPPPVRFRCLEHKESSPEDNWTKISLGFNIPLMAN